MKGKGIFIGLTIIFLSFAILSGCSEFLKFFGLDGEENSPQVNLTLTEPADGSDFSVADSVTFTGNYENVKSIKLKIGDNEYDTMDVFADGKWEVTVKLSDVGIGHWQVVASAYVEGQTTPAKTTDPITITVYNWLNATNDGIYRYIILSDSEYSYPAEITDIATDGTYAYVSGYYMPDSSKIQPFIYRIDPDLGTYNKKIILNPIDTADGELLPVLVALGDNKEYLAYSAKGMNIHIKTLDSNLNPTYSYDDDGYSYIFRGLYYKTGYLYLTGEDYATHEALIFKIQDTGSSFGEPSSTTYNPHSNGSNGYDITVAGNNNIYVAAMVKNTSATDLNRVVWEFDNNLNNLANSNNETIDGEMYGIYYCASTNKLYATGVLPDAGSDYKTVFADGMDPNSLYLSALDHHFHQSHNTGAFHDEEGRGIIFDSDKGYAVIVGFQQATDSSMTNAKGSICVRNGATEVKTVYFAEDGYSESCLDNVEKIGNRYYAVGYAKDTNGNNPLIMWIPDSY